MFKFHEFVHFAKPQVQSLEKTIIVYGQHGATSSGGCDGGCEASAIKSDGTGRTALHLAADLFNPEVSAAFTDNCSSSTAWPWMWPIAWEGRP